MTTMYHPRFFASLVSAFGAILLLTASPAHAILFQHLDATVEGSVVTNGGGVVSNWVDQSGQGNDAAAVGVIGSPMYPGPNLSPTGLAGVDLLNSRNGFTMFNPIAQDDFLDFGTTAVGNSGFSLLVAFRAESIKGEPIRDVLLGNHGNPGGVANSFVLRYQGGQPQFFAGGVQTNHSGPIVSPGQTVVLGVNWNQSTSEYEFYSSLNQGIDVGNLGLGAGFDLSSTQNLFLGTTLNGGQFMDGMIGEVKLWNENLDTTAFEQEADALRTKWVGDPAKLTVDRDSGEVSFFVGNPSSTISSYAIRSPGGRLDPSEWDSITDGTNNGALDSDPWIRISDLLTDDTEVAEGELPGGDGGVSIAAGTTISLGNIWRRGSLQDLQMQVLDLNGNVSFPSIDYIGEVLLLDGDYNDDGVVDAADYTVWRDNVGNPAGSLPNDPSDQPIGETQYLTWRGNYGSSLSGSPSAGVASAAEAPEPQAFVLLVLGMVALGLGQRFRIAGQFTRRQNSAYNEVAVSMNNLPCRTFSFLVLAFSLTSAVATAATPDRLYLLGDNSALSTENGDTNLGGVLGTSTGASLTGVTLDHAINDDVSFIDAQDLTVHTNAGSDPRYIDVGSGGLGRPGATGVSVGADFDGDDYVSGAEFGNPADGDSGQIVNNYNDITTRYMQGWVRPTSAGSPGQRQVVVRDTQQFQIHIDTGEAGTPTWGYRYAAVDATTDVEVALNEWSHVGQYAQNRSIFYINGVAVAVEAGPYGQNAGGESLSLGAEETGGVAGAPSNFFTGQLDDFDVRVAGDNSGLMNGANWGEFLLEEDNAYIANLVSNGTLVAGDVNGDGMVNGNGTGLAANDDVRFFLEHYRDQRSVDGFVVGDLESRTMMGDLDYSGTTDLRDWYLLVQNHEDSAAAAAINFVALVGSTQAPEPTSLALFLTAFGAFGVARSRRRPLAIA